MITLVLGGVRSGKNELAEQLAGTGPVTYLATARLDGEVGFSERVQRHRDRRPAHWATVEEPVALPAALARLEGTVLVDALGPWVANHLVDEAGERRPDLDGLLAALRARAGDTILVSEEVGLGVHAPTALGRRFADLLGETNRRVADVADRCLLVVAGRVVELPAHGGAPPSAIEAGDAVPAPTASGWRAALGLLTPLGGAAAPTPAAFGWFPVVGALLGLLLGGWWWLADEWFGPLAGAAAVVAADLALTGALHFDGLVDSADGLLPHLSRERRLAVMAEPTAGAFGIAVGASALLLRAAALASFDDPAPLLLAALWCASRTLMTASAAAAPYARAGGLATLFLAPKGTASHPSIAAAAGLLLAVVLALGDRPASVLAVAAAAAGAAGARILAVRRLGGFTGDTLGATGVVAETAGRLVALAVV